MSSDQNVSRNWRACSADDGMRIPEECDVSGGFADCGVSRHEVSAGNNPSGKQDRENDPPGEVPFATIHVRVSKPAGYQYGDCPNGDETRNEYVYDVLDGFERVLKVTRHRGFLDYFELWGSFLVNAAFFVAGAFLGFAGQFS